MNGAAAAPANTGVKSEGEFSWKTYMEQDGSLATYDQSLFPQLRCSERRLSELILRPGRKIIVRRGDRLEHAKIEIVFETKLYVTFNSGFECIDLDAVMPDNILRINGNRRNIENEDLGLLGDNNPGEELTTADLELAHLTMAEAVKVGQYFELQDRINPCKVYIAQVFENRGGLLLIGRNGAKPDLDRPVRIFVTDERCHALGWLESGAQTKLFFADGAESVMEVAKTNPVTRWVFEHFRVREHKFQENMSLEVLQASNGGAFFAGHVTEIINSHYFTVKIAESLSGMEKTITCSKSHPQIFPSGWCQRHGLRLTPPSDYIGEEEFSMLVYEAKLGLKGKAPESLFDPPKTLYKPERLRNVEVLDIRTKNEMYPAKILRWMKHIVWVSYCHYNNATPPGVLSTRCGLIFPCGFAQQHGIRLCKPCPYERLGAIPPSVDRFGLRKTCTSHRTPVFVHRDKRFIPAVYLDNDLMLPTVYLRKNCFCGPFLDPAKVKIRPGKYPPGPLPGIIRSILADIINCAYRPEDLSKLLSCSKDTSAPIIFAKSRVHGKPYRFRVECCEKVSEFCGWLRNICILLDACPELFNINPEPCRSFCSYLRENMFMGPDRHAWTANYQNISTPPRKSTRVETCNTVSRNNMTSKRKKKNDKPQIRRPVTRAVLRKTIRSPKSDESRSVSKSPVKKEKASSVEPLKQPTLDGYGTVVTATAKHPELSRVLLSPTVEPPFKSNSTLIRTQALPPKISHLKRPSPTSFSARGSSGPVPSVATTVLNTAIPSHAGPVVFKKMKSGPRATGPTTTGYSNDEKVVRRRRKVVAVGASNSITMTSAPSLFPCTSTAVIDPSTAIITSSQQPPKLLVSSTSTNPKANVVPGRKIAQRTDTVFDSIHMPPIFSNPIKWDCAQLSAWLKQTDLGGFAELLERDEVDGEAFMLLSVDECINTLKIKLGPAMKLESLGKGLKAYYEKYFRD